MRTSPLDIARRVVADESAALGQLCNSLGDAFSSVVELLLRPGAQVIVSGLGKSGNIAQKIAASLTSTGTPAGFLHPVEALHGDLGVVTSNHVLIALSRSGNTEEVLRFAAHFRRLGGPVVGMTQGRESRLAELSQVALLLPDLPEAGPHGLAPTTSCIMMLALGDALAMALLHARDFKPENFAQYHPEGTLGRRLLLRASDLMHTGENLPIVRDEDTVDRLLLEMSGKRLGLALIVDADGRLLGTFTDGDLRRLLQRAPDFRKFDALGAWAASRRSPDMPRVPTSTIEPSRLAVDCVARMRDGQITSLIATDDSNRPVGVLRLMDLINAGVA